MIELRKTGLRWLPGLLLFLAACAQAGPVEPLPGTTTPPETTLPAEPTEATLPADATATRPVRELTPIAPYPRPEDLEESPLANLTPIPTPENPGLRALFDQARQDLAQRLGIDPGGIELVELTSVVWPDGSLGCPQPGVEYTQMQVEGTRIRLVVEGRVYSYHSGEGRAPFLCERPVGPQVYP